MFHIDYNSVRGKYDEEELRCLCRALGFQSDLMSINLPKDAFLANEHLTVKELDRFINLKYLDFAVDKTFNPHTADWNLNVFKKALLLVDHRVLSYQELHDVRVAFSMYEHPDLKGMETDEKTINRCLKMCGRVMAPLKIQHRIKHMSQNFDEEGRIQLFEFLDLILWTELYDKQKIPSTKPVSTVGKQRDIYQIEDFQHIIKHYDEKLAQHLNELYLHEEWSFTKEEFSKQKLPNELPVSREFRLNQMRRSNANYKTLKTEVSKSEDLVHVTASGHVRPRPITAPHLEYYEQSEKSSVYTAYSQQKPSVGELVRDYIHMPTVRFVKSAQPSYSTHNKGDRNSYTAPNSTPKNAGVQPAVTEEERNEGQQQIQDLEFYMSTINNRYDNLLQKDIDEYIPGYSPKPPKPDIPQHITKKKQPNPALNEETINKLAYAPYRPAPKPCHASKCDARFRGWHRVKSTKGHHYILTTAAFSNTQNAQNHEHIHKTHQNQVKTVKGDYVVRRTSDANVKPEVHRPATGPPCNTSQAPRPLAVVQSEGSKVRSHATARLARPTRESNENRRNSLGLRSSAKTLKTIREGSADLSTRESSARSYSFNDFKMYDEYERQCAEAKNTADLKTMESAVAATSGELGATDVPSIVVRRASFADTCAGAENKAVNSTAEESSAHMQTELDRKRKRYEQYKGFTDRRKLSPFVRSRILESAIAAA